MSRELVSDELWSVIEPLIPPEPPRPKGRRPHVPARRALAGIIFVLRTGIPWEWLPKELGCGSGMTCWRRLRDWARAGVWHRLHTVLLECLQAADRIDRSRAPRAPRSRLCPDLFPTAPVPGGMLSTGGLFAVR